MVQKLTRSLPKILNPGSVGNGGDHCVQIGHADLRKPLKILMKDLFVILLVFYLGPALFSLLIQTSI